MVPVMPQKKIKKTIKKTFNKKSKKKPSASAVSESVFQPQLLSRLLTDWYKKSHRPLPWRQSKDPYKIWISEVMLQQTTVTAVVPYFEKFMQKFPDVKTLAATPLESVLESWAGLGYYSRARNLHKAAQQLQTHFPQSYQQLIELPGFGPYTSRAISSLAFGETVGVLDGNVIRVLTRLLGEKSEWWKTEIKNHLQNISDQLATANDSYFVNQALMELGATVCTPTSPSCMECPWKGKCSSFKNQWQNEIPLKKPRKENQIWQWSVQPVQHQSKLMMIQDPTSPILKQQWMLPGAFKKLNKKPTEFLFKHQITHHEIYVQLEQPFNQFQPTSTTPVARKPINKKEKYKTNKNVVSAQSIWVKKEDIAKINPSSLLTKLLKHIY